MKPPYNSFDLHAVDRFSGDTDSARIRQVSHCVLLLRQGVEKGFGVLAQRKMLTQTICDGKQYRQTCKDVREHVALAAYILMDKHVIESMSRCPEWTADQVIKYLEKRFENFEEIKKFYGRSHRL
jgi:hypothetical protein